MRKLIHVFVRAAVVRPRKTSVRLTYDANVIAAVRKANLRLLHDNRKTELGSTVTTSIAGTCT